MAEAPSPAEVRRRWQASERRSRHLRWSLVAADAVALVAGLLVAHGLMGSPVERGRTLTVVVEFLALGVLWIAAMVVNRMYTARCVERLGEEIRRLFVAGFTSVTAMVAIGFVIDATLPSRGWVAGVFSLVTMALLIDRTIARYVFVRLRSSGSLTRRIAVVGTDHRAAALVRSLRANRQLGYEVVGLIGPEPPSDDHECPVLGDLADADDALRSHGCVGAVLSVSSLGVEQVNATTRRLAEHGFHVALSTTLRDIDVTRMRPQRIDGEVLLYVEPAIRTGWRLVAKRVFDVVFSTVALVLTLPLMIVAALLVRIESRGPFLFRQDRVGRHGEPFQMLKLRTMCADAESQQKELLSRNEATGPMFKIREDPRVTRVGRVLRRTSIDELPQFWNVIKGDMSVVGPRPALQHEVAGWDRALHKRLSVPPGITGMWQVSGRSDASFEQYRRLDLYYVDNWSLLHDIEVIAKTVWVVLSARGAS